MAANFYPSDGVGSQRPTDLVGVDPMFNSFNGSFLLPNGAANPNDFHLKAGSPAIGKGNATYNADIGAYTSDGKGNKH